MPEKLTTRRIASLIQSGRPCDVRDAQCRGLVLRVKGKDSWAWNVRRTVRKTDWRMDLGDSWSLDEARSHAGEIDRRIRIGEDPWEAAPAFWREYYDPLLRGKLGVPEPAKPIRMTRSDVVQGPTLAWCEAVPLWLAEVQRTRKKSTFDSYRCDINHPVLRKYAAWHVSAFTRQHAAEVLHDVHATGTERQAEVIAVAIRRFFAFLGGDGMTRRTGVEFGRMTALRTPERSMLTDAEVETRSNGGGGRIPDGPMVGVIARALRDPESRASERDRLAGLLLLLTAQRRMSVVTARKREFKPVGDGSGLWHMPPLHRKSGSKKLRQGIPVGDHVVPLPRRVWSVVQRAMELAPDSEWLFAGTKPRRKGIEVTHIDPSTINHLYAAIAGNPCTPHDVRRALATTYKIHAGLTLHQVKLILDHSEGVKSGDVTTTHYSYDPEIEEKLKVVEGYLKWIDKWAAARD